MPPKPNPTLYSIQKTFMWFTIVSVLLTLSLGGIVWMDYNREWKGYQKRFVDLKLKKAKAELKGVKVDQKKADELARSIKAAQTAAAAHKAETEKLHKDLVSLESKIAKAKADYQTKKQFEDSYKYYLEETREQKEAKKAADYEAKLKKLSPEVLKLKSAQESLEKERDEKTAALDQFKEREKALQKELDKVLEEKTRLEKREKRLEPSIAKDVLNAPMLDFIAPTLKIQQVVLEDLQDDYHFAKVQKVDRCMTCHLGIDQKGFEDAPQPFRTHPDLDLYLGSLSPHPLEKTGCTSCHGGSGQAVSFIEAAHTPNDEAEAKEWVKKYKWHEMEHWEKKMLPMKHVQASCTTCHQGVVEVPKAGTLNRGRQLASQMGCLNCHKVNGYDDRWKVGPDLTNVQSKLSDEWIAKWLDNPKDFRASTKMPRIFHLSNTSDAESKAKSEAAIQSIVAYLRKNSGTVELTKPPVAGDAANGEKLVKTLGCLGCHSAAGVDAGHWAPELSGLGSKVSAEWLYTWLKDPKHYSKETRMPSLRLSDQEASDIAGYLLSQRNEAFEAKSVPQARPEVVDGLILEAMQGTMRRSEAEDALKKMGADEKMQFLGKKSIGQQGCFGCHSIAGFEDAKPIGAELSDEGRKDINKFDFGFVDVERTREGFIHQKLKEPRSFDQGKLKAYYDRLRMPQFDLKDEEIDALTTFVLSLSEEQVPMQSRKRLDLREQQVEKGRLLVQKLNCTGCHTLEGHEAVLRRITEDAGSAPPVLDGEGAKVQEKWLHDFIHSPTPIRPWLTYRMPTFGLGEDDLNTLVEYFHNAAKQKTTFGDIQAPESDAATVAAGQKLFGTLQCAKCHEVNKDSAAMGTSFLAPDLSMSKTRLKPGWVVDWLREPQKLQEGTMMPTFFSEGQSPVPDVLDGDAEKQISAIRDYLYRYVRESEAKK